MKTLQERFEAKFTKGDGCWEWTAFKDQCGYGRFSFAGRSASAHRVAYQMYVDEIPDGLCVLHRCDNRRCVNPTHLFLGTNTDNIHDCMNKGRSMHGEKNSQARLTERQVKAIRARRNDGALTADLAKEFGVSGATIYKIAHYLRWAYLR